MANSAFTVTGSASGTGSVTSVAVSSSDLTVTGSPITTSGTIGLSLNTVPITKGGTGDVSFTPYAVITGGTSSTTPLQSIASVGTSGEVLTSNGAGALPTFQSVAGTGTVTSVATGVGLAGGPITSSGTVNVLINAFAQGRLTLTSGVPVTTNDVTGATTVYFCPYNGNYMALFTSGAWQLYTFAQISIAVPATTNTNYDVFAYDSGGSVTLELAAWTNQNTRATLLASQDGVYCKTGALSRRFLGTFCTTNVSGQAQDATTGRYLWNYYNRVSKQMRAISSTPTWIYSTTAWRQANADSLNQLNFILGVIDDSVYCYVAALGFINSGSSYANVGLGINSKTIPNNGITIALYSSGNPTSAFATATPSSPAQGLLEGLNYVAWLEYGASSGVTFISDGSSGNNASGIDGSILC